MPLQLNFRVEDRGGVMVLITKNRNDEDVVRPASSAEVDLWNALTRKFAAPSRESYIRVNEQDLVSVLMERDHLRKQTAYQQKKILELQAELAEAHGQGHPSHEPTDGRGASGGEPEPREDDPGTA